MGSKHKKVQMLAVILFLIFGMGCAVQCSVQVFRADLYLFKLGWQVVA